jgi:membrane-associated phospholipid phosphatase
VDLAMGRFFTVVVVCITFVPILGAQTAALGGVDAVEDRPVSLKQLVPNILSDQKQIWTSPVRAFKNKNWIPILAVSAIAVGLVAADPVDTGYFRRTGSFHSFNHVFSASNATLATAIVPISLYAVGLVRKDSYATKTALLAGEAVADAEILTTILKGVDRRVRPINLPANTKFGDTWFESKLTNGGFPSGPTITAFAVATVMARRYHSHRWVPYVAYGLAGAIGFSRITLSAHFPSDVFMGAALGFSISRFSVLRQ